MNLDLKLKDQNWFNEEWALKTRAISKNLVRLYLAACDSAWRAPYPFQTVRLGGLWGGRKLWVVGAFVKDAVIRHVQQNLERAQLVELRALMASHPTTEDTRLGVKLTASEESVREAKEKLREKEEIRKRIAAALRSAADEFKMLDGVVGKHKSVVNQVLGFLFGLIKYISPLAVLGWAVSQFSELRHLPLWQGVVLCLSWIVVYHLLGLLGIPFHDAGYRKYLLFEGYTGQPDDGIPPLFPNVARIEDEFYNHLGISKPIVVSLDDIIPLLHAAGSIFLVSASLWFLPLNATIRSPAIVVGLIIIASQLQTLFIWRSLLRMRYPNQGIVSLAVIVLLDLLTGQFGKITESESDESGAGDENP